MLEVKRLLSPEPLLAVGDFGTVENKELVERKLFDTIKDKQGKWASRSHSIALLPPYKTMSYRIRVAAKAKDSSNYVLAEGIIPQPDGKLTFLELTRQVQPYGRYATYSDEMMIYGFDHLVPALVEDTSDQAAEIVNDIAAKAWFGGNQVWSAPGGLTRDLIAKIRISLGKFAGADKQVYCIITPEDLYDLKVAYNSASANLFQETSLNEKAIVQGKFEKFEGVIFIEDDSKYMYTNSTDGHRNAIFYCADKNGKPPVGMVEAAGRNAEMIAKPLGSAGTSDPINQIGSIGVKWKGLGAMVTSEETLARVDITPYSSTTINGLTLTSIGEVQSYYDYSNGKIYVNGNEVNRGATINGLSEGAVRYTDTSPASYTLSPASNSASFNEGTTKVVTVYNEDGDQITLDSTFTISSSNTSVATVALGTSTNSGKLVVTGATVAADSNAIITVSKGRRTGSLKVTVLNA